MHKIYLVGGAVRDGLLGLPIRERDYVVVGATPEEMTASGFRPVGKDFPVFLHPKTHEEYALARTERKVAQGHQGFQFYTAPEVTLEQDLQRRDLTINAMAQDDEGHLIDPYHGEEDLKLRVLRHVSPAFSEDPLRILRVARFRAYLGNFEFTIAPETLALMQDMVRHNVLAELSDERIWQEMRRALQTDFPHYFFDTLREVGALPLLFDEIPRAELGTFSFGSENLALIRFAILCFEAKYLRACPKEFADLAELVRTRTKAGREFPLLSATEKVQFLRSLDFLRRGERLNNWLIASKTLFPTFPLDTLTQAVDCLRGLDRQALAAGCAHPSEIPARIFAAECEALASF